jgi:hypothetical protein
MPSARVYGDALELAKTLEDRADDGLEGLAAECDGRCRGVCLGDLLV